MQTVLRDEMAILKDLPDDDFDRAFAKEIKAEAKQSMRVVYFIREANRRKHWLKDFSTLAKYCAHHGISNGDFYRKLAVANTIRDLPEIEGKILEGKLNPSTVAQVNTFCRSETKLRDKPVSVDEKRDLLFKIEGHCAKTVERELAKISPKSAIPDKKRQIAEGVFSNQFTSDQALENKLGRLRELLSNSLPICPTQNDLLHKICDIALKSVDPLIKNERALGRKNNQEMKVTNITLTAKNKRYISPVTKRQVRLRDGDQCTFVHENGERCETKINLQLDHIKPFAKGGDNSLENLRQVCRNHNQWLAITEYGHEKMSEYLPLFDKS